METVQPSAGGFDAARLDHFVAGMQSDIEREQYDGAVVIVARGGRVVLHRALGFAERASLRVLQKDDVFYLFSVTKALTATATLARVDRGQLALTMPVAEIIPEFASKGKQRVTIAQLLTHTAGMSAGFPPVAQEMMGNLEAVVAAVCRQGLDSLPGDGVSYSPITAYAVLGEVVRRLDGGERSLRQIFAEDIFTPLGMPDTALGLRPDLAERRVPVVVRDRREGLFPPEVLEGFNVMLQEDTEIPGGGGVGTAADIFRLAEMLRCGGELDGVRVLAPAVIRLAATNHTGLKPNNLWNYTREVRGWDEFPAALGLGFFVRGTGIFPTYFGTLASPNTFGAVGAGSTLFWIDPERDITFVCLTAGALEESYSMERFQRLSDLVLSAVVEYACPEPGRRARVRMITEAQLQQIFTPLTGDPSPRLCRMLSGNINTILKVEAKGQMYGLRIRSQEQVYRYEPDLLKEVFIGWLLDPAHAGANDTEKARALARLRAARRGTVPPPHRGGIEPTGLAFDWSRQILPQPYFVYEWIEGEPLWDAPAEQLYRAAGHALASLHRVRFDAFYADFFAIGNAPQAWADRFRAALDKEVGEARSRLSPTLLQAMEHITIPATLPFSPCLIHNDFSPGNILVRDGRLAAVIDWDNAVVDVAPLDFVKMKYWTAKDGQGQLGHNPVLFRAFVTGYGPHGIESVESETFAWYEVVWLLRVFNFEMSKQERGLERAPGYPAAAEYAIFLEGVIGRLSARRGSLSPTSSSDHLKK